MKATELTRAQLDELKVNHLFELRGDESIYWSEIVDAPEMFTDEEIFHYYDGVIFVEEDFPSSNA